MVKALFDTNILIDYLNGVEAARQEIALYEDHAISLISWMEVMAGVPPVHATATEAFLARFHRVEVDQAVAVAAVELRREHRLKLPDAIVWASARTRGFLLVTRDTKDMPANYPGIRNPYRL